MLLWKGKNLLQNYPLPVTKSDINIGTYDVIQQNNCFPEKQKIITSP